MKTIQSLFAQKSWANNELFNAIAAIDRVNQDAQHAAAVHTAIRTLNHIYVVDRIFQAQQTLKPHLSSMNFSSR
jgi:uncharacterized damage-inducible protein DinB